MHQTLGTLLRTAALIVMDNAESFACSGSVLSALTGVVGLLLQGRE